MPTLSFLICNHNHAPTLRRSMDAICGEARSDDEIIALDDGSTDESFDILRTYAGRFPNVRVLRNARNFGLLPSSMRALAEAKGEFVGLFAADDHLMPGMGERARDLARRFPRAGLLAQEALVVHADGTELRERFRIAAESALLSPGELVAQFRDGHYFWIPTSGAFFRRGPLVEAGGWVAALDWAADWFACYALALRHGAALWRAVGSTHYVHETSFGRSGARDPRRRKAVQARFFDLLHEPGHADLRRAFLAAPFLVVCGLRPSSAVTAALRRNDLDFACALWLARLEPTRALLRLRRRARMSQARAEPDRLGGE